MGRRTTWHSLAAQDLAEACLHLEDDSPAGVQRLLDAIEQALALLHSNPTAGRLREFRAPMAQGIRSWAIAGFGDFLLFYRPIAAEIEVVRFIHGTREMPGLLDDEERETGLYSGLPR